MITRATVAAVEYGGDWELPPIMELFDFSYLPATESWGPLAVNRTVLMVLFAVLAIGTVFFLGTSKGQIVPGKLQAAVESVVEFIRERIAIEIIGPEGTRYVPLLTTLFAFILLNNLFKLTPFIMFPPTSRMAITGMLAVLVWLIYIGAGIRAQGLGGYLKSTLVPPAPLAILPILVPIEFISNIILRPFTLAIRLVANMIAGHILVVITLITIHAFLVWGPGLPVGIAGLALAPVVFGFELFIIALQAYIFVMLTAVYISASVHAEH